MRYRPAYLLGRLANGEEPDRGRVLHALGEDLLGRAACGTAPGARSAGWQLAADAIVTCRRCRKMIERTEMRNLAMQEKLRRRQAVDISGFAREGSYYVLPFAPATGTDYCDAKEERWVWSIGRRLADGVILASLGGDLYQHNDFECLWLR